MNIQHSSRTDEWYTPLEILVMVRSVLGQIDLDPASSAEANDRVAALKYFDQFDDGLKQDWGKDKAIFINPPGGKTGNKSNVALFWKKLMGSEIKHAIFMGFSIECLQTTQGKGVRSAMEFPFCVPSSRIKFFYPHNPKKSSPSHSNVIIYVPGSEDRTDLFCDVFSNLGAVANTGR